VEIPQTKTSPSKTQRAGRDFPGCRAAVIVLGDI
jgi:hypothetical protein